jgi:Subtilase family
MAIMFRSRTLRHVILLGLALSPRLPAQSPETATLISLTSTVIDTGRPVPEPPPTLRAVRAGSDEIVLVKFPGPITSRQAEALRAASLRVYTYLPYYAWLVRMPAGAATKPLLDSLGASWSGPFHPAYKISPRIAAVGVGPDRSLEEPRPVMLEVFPDFDLDGVVRSIRGLGTLRVAGMRRDPFFSRVRLMMTPSEIVDLRERLAGLREVFWIDLEPRKSLLNDRTVWIGQSGLTAHQSTPIFDHGIFGEGQTVAILDTGLDADSCYFRDPDRGLPPTNVCDGGTAVDTEQRKVLAVDFLWRHDCAHGIRRNEWDTFGHGTHVAGTVAGDNFAHVLVHDHADGMAPGAKLVIQDAGVHPDPCADLPGIGCPVVDLKPLFQQAYDQGARIHTNSWGDNEEAAVQNDYTAASQDVDQFQWDHKDDLIFFAAGNSGPRRGSVGSPSTNKNGVSVGATLRGYHARSMAEFSSCGPTADGRIKPDVAVPGSDIVSAGSDDRIDSQNCGISITSGTSTASPAAAGFAALIRQYYMDGWYPTGSRKPTDGFTPSAALLKATLINSAVDMPHAGPAPDRCQGWGRVQLDNVLSFAGQARKLWVKDDAAPFAEGSTGEERAYRIQVAAGEPLKVTLAWTDHPSTPIATPNLNNDLDLVVSGPGGSLPGNGSEPDRRNNVEQVSIENPPAGLYTITVRSWNVPNGPQPFALVATGDLVP